MMEEESDEIEQEIDVIYVPLPAQLNILQYPLVNQEQFRLNEYANPSECLYRPIQKKLEISYQAKQNFTNLDNKDNSINNKKQRDYEIEEQPEDEKSKQILTYSSTLINNRTNYFVQHYDKESNKILWFAVDSFMQMRPVIKENTQNKFQISEKEEQLTSVTKKGAKDDSKQKLLLERHPERYAENQLRYYNSFQEIMNKEDPIKMKLYEEQQFQYAKLYKSPSEIIELKPLSKKQYQEKLESGGFEEKK